MSWQGDPGDRQLQSPANEQVNQAQVNRIPGAPVDYPVQVTILRIVIVCFVASKAKFLEQIVVKDLNGFLRLRVCAEPLPDILCKTVQHRAVRTGVDVRILRPAKQ